MLLCLEVGKRGLSVAEFHWTSARESRASFTYALLGRDRRTFKQRDQPVQQTDVRSKSEKRELQPARQCLSTEISEEHAEASPD